MFGWSTVAILEWLIKALFRTRTQTRIVSFYLWKSWTNFSPSERLSCNKKYYNEMWLLLSPARKCCQILVRDGEGAVSERSFLAQPCFVFFWKRSLRYQAKNLAEEFWREEIIFFHRKSCLLGSCWFVNSRSNEKSVPYSMSFFFYAGIETLIWSLIIFLIFNLSSSLLHT